MGISGPDWCVPSDPSCPAPGPPSAEAGPSRAQTWHPALAMALGLRCPRQPAASEEVRSVPRPGGSPGGRCTKQPLASVEGLSFAGDPEKAPEACQPAAARLLAPSRRGPALAGRPPETGPGLPARHAFGGAATPSTDPLVGALPGRGWVPLHPCSGEPRAGDPDLPRCVPSRGTRRTRRFSRWGGAF